jgi:DNA-binding MarR family transcriptional regulator
MLRFESRRPKASTLYPLGPALEFLERLWALNHALERLSGEMTSSLGITAQQRLVIRCLGRYPGIPAGQLAALLHLDKGTISATVRRLASKGLVERRKDPVDGRRTSLGLTSKGRSLDRSTPGTVEHAVERAISTADAKTVRATRLMLEWLAEALNDELIGSRQKTFNQRRRSKKKGH